MSDKGRPDPAPGPPTNGRRLAGPAESEASLDDTSGPGSGRGAAQRRRIEEAALRMFAEHGYAKATIKRIAEAAELRSSALIYFYFPDKAALLRAVIERYAFLVNALDRPDPAAVAEPPEVYLPILAMEVLAYLEDGEVERMYRLWMTEWPLFERLGITIRSSDPSHNAHAFVERYLARQVELGRLVAHDTAASARSFIAQVWAQAEAKALFPAIYPEPIEDAEFVSSMVALFLRGLTV